MTAFEEIFNRLKKILQSRSGKFTVKPDTDTSYGLYAPVGPATLAMWKGKSKAPVMPIAWVETGKSYVSFHLMGIYGNQKLVDSLSPALKARMQGKTCFNFKKQDDELFNELEKITDSSIEGFRKGGYIK